MKRLTLFLFSLIALASCQVVVVEPAYDPRNSITGSYTWEEYSDTYSEYYSYSVNVSKSSYASNEVYINNFYDSGISIYAYLSGGKLTIPYQIVDGFEVEGVINVNGSTLVSTYRVRDQYNNTVSDFCKATASRYY